MKKTLNFLSIFLISIIFFSCVKFEKVDQRSRPTDPEERRRQAINEGRGTGINDLFNRRGGKTNYQFSSSNPMWRASLETLDFLPLTTVDYSGGIIITDWYSEDNNDAIKLTVRFLSNEIRSDSLKIVIHKKKCDSNSNCKTFVSQSNVIKDELRSTILRKAALLEKSGKEKK